MSSSGNIRCIGTLRCLCNSPHRLRCCRCGAHTQITELQRQKFEQQELAEELEREQAQAMAPTVRQYQSEIKELQEDLKEKTEQCDATHAELEEVCCCSCVRACVRGRAQGFKEALESLGRQRRTQRSAGDLELMFRRVAALTWRLHFQACSRCLGSLRSPHNSCECCVCSWSCLHCNPLLSE